MLNVVWSGVTLQRAMLLNEKAAHNRWLIKPQFDLKRGVTVGKDGLVLPWSKSTSSTVTEAECVALLLSNEQSCAVEYFCDL